MLERFEHQHAAAAGDHETVALRVVGREALIRVSFGGFVEQRTDGIE